MLRRQARSTLLAFACYTMVEYSVNWHHRVLCDYLDRFAKGLIKRLMVFMPPRYGKSELVSRRFPAFILGQNPDAKIIAASYASSLAAEMNRDVQRIIDSERYHRLFPGTMLTSKGNRSTHTGKWLRNNELFEVVGRKGVYRCAGVGTGITGKGMDYGIIDDPIKDPQEAYSPTSRNSVWEWYNGAFRSRLEKDACILVTTTRWHRDDLAGRLLSLAESDPDADQWTVVRFEAVKEERENPDDPRAVGEPLWPDKYDAKALRATEATHGPQGWAALYQQNPKPDGGAWFDASYFGQHIWFDQWPADCVIHKVMALDPSLGRTETCDYGAIVFLMRVYENGRHILYIDADIERRDTKQSVSDSFRLGRAFDPLGFGVEAVGFQQLLAEQIRNESVSTGYPLPVYPCTIDTSVTKNIRIMGLVPYLANQELRFKRGSRGARLLINQLMDFPLAEYDDGPDALEMAIRLSEFFLRGAGEEETTPYRVSA